MSKKTKGTNVKSTVDNKKADLSAYGVTIVDGQVVLEADFRVHASNCSCREICGPVRFVWDTVNAWLSWATSNPDMFAACPVRKNKDGKKLKHNEDKCKTESGKFSVCQAKKQMTAWKYAYLSRKLPGEFALWQMMDDPDCVNALLEGDVAFIKAEHHKKVSDNLDSVYRYQNDYVSKGNFVSKTKGARDSVFSKSQVNKLNKFKQQLAS